MKILEEKIITSPTQSFRVLYPSLKNNYYWHYHPEYELTYIEANTGIRHVGQHLSSYKGSDLILIGPYLPHLNFDYGVLANYHQVIQLKEGFMGNAIDKTPEFTEIERLLKLSVKGLSFTGITKKEVARKMKILSKSSPFKQLINLLEIFQVLAQSEEVTELNQNETNIHVHPKDKIRMDLIFDYINKNYNKDLNVNEISALVYLTTPAFCRYFKKRTNMTFTQFVNQFRITQACNLLLSGHSVTNVCFEVGFQSLSYFNKLFHQIKGINPSYFAETYLSEGL